MVSVNLQGAQQVQLSFRTSLPGGAEAQDIIEILAPSGIVVAAGVKAEAMTGDKRRLGSAARLGPPQM